MYSRELAEARVMDQYVLTTIPTLATFFGPDWKKRIQSDILDIHHPNLCAVGQISGDWNKTWPKMKDAGITPEQVPALMAPEGLSKLESYYWYRRATCAWQRWFRNQQSAGT